MLAFKLPRFRPASGSSLRQRAKALAETTAKLLHFPVKRRVICEAPDSARRALMTGTAAAALVAPATAFGGSGPGHPPEMLDAELLSAEQDWLAAGLARDEAAKRVSAADEAYEAYLGLCPREMVPTDEDRDAADDIRRALGKPVWSGASFHCAYAPSDQNGGPESVHVWTSKYLQTCIAAAPGALGRAGTTPHLIRRWRSLVPVAQAYEAKCEAARVFSCIDEMDEAFTAARQQHDVAEKRVIELPAHTAVGIGVKARVWTAKRAGEWGSMWDIKLPAPLQAVVDAALAVGAPG